MSREDEKVLTAMDTLSSGVVRQSACVTVCACLCKVAAKLQELRRRRT